MAQRARSSNIEHDPYSKADRGRVFSWSSAVNYYFLTLFFSIFVFIVVLAFFYDGYDESPLVIAGLASIVSIVSFVLFREVVLRRSRAREHAVRQLAHHLRAATKHRGDRDDREKLTLELNEKLLREIRSKSDAAKVLGNLADAHREVFELCDDYLVIASREITRARVGSPRIPALRKGSVSASKRHRFHMLKWAELKTRSFTAEAKNAGTIIGKIGAAEGALEAVDRALEVYPGERALTDSREVLLVFLASTRLRSLLDEADAAEMAGDLQGAVRSYNDALTEVNRNAGTLEELERFAVKIRSEVERITKLMEN